MNLQTRWPLTCRPVTIAICMGSIALDAYAQDSSTERFNKIANSGQVIPQSAQLGDGLSEWACTLDTASGLLWETKSASASHLRYAQHRYTWFDASTGSGAAGNPLTCNNALGVQPCNTETYAAAVNSSRLCGHNDWRMPTLSELQSILDTGYSAPAVNPDYFPNALSDFYWTGSPYANSTTQAWYVHFGTAFSYGNASRSSNRYVRLVRGDE